MFENEELKEKLRQREKALNDYGNDIAAAREEGREDMMNELTVKWRNMGLTEEQIKNLLK